MATRGLWHVMSARQAAGDAGHAVHDRGTVRRRDQLAGVRHLTAGLEVERCPAERDVASLVRPERVDRVASLVEHRHDRRVLHLCGRVPLEAVAELLELRVPAWKLELLGLFAAAERAARARLAALRFHRPVVFLQVTDGLPAQFQQLHLVAFGEHARADARLIRCALQSEGSTVEARILGTEVTYKLGAPGRHLVLNSLAVLAASALAGADLALAALALAKLQPASGRGARISLEMPGGTALLIDESYNANPASMRAALALLGHSQVGPRGRRIAILGDMLELGPRGRDLHRELAEAVLANEVDLVFCCGPLMRGLWEALPSGRQGSYAEASTALEPQVLAAIQPGDAVMVKGSLGSRMAPIVKALQTRYRRVAPATTRAPLSTMNG